MAMARTGNSGQVPATGLSAGRPWLSTTLRDKAKQSAFTLLNRSIGKVIAAQLGADHLEWQKSDALRSQKYLALRALMADDMPADLPLSAYELSVFSQNGEDGIIFELCRRLQPAQSFVEFGIQSGYQGNCVLLADVLGWSGVFIESDPAYFGNLQLKYSANTWVQTIQEEITPANINVVFDRVSVPPDLGVLSIDIDGNDYWVWRALDRYRPAIVIIEYNARLSFDDPVVQAYEESSTDGGHLGGASLRAMQDLGSTLGYELVHTDLAGVNAFFVRKDLLQVSPSNRTPAFHGINHYLMGTVFAGAPSLRADRVPSGG